MTVKPKQKSPFLAIVGFVVLGGLVLALIGNYSPKPNSKKEDNAHAYYFIVETDYPSVKIDVKNTKNFQPSFVGGAAYPFTFTRSQQKPPTQYTDNGAYDPRPKGWLRVSATIKPDPTLALTGYVSCRIYRVGNTTPVDIRRREIKKKQQGDITVTCEFKTPFVGRP